MSLDEDDPLHRIGLHAVAAMVPNEQIHDLGGGQIEVDGPTWWWMR